MVKLWQGDCFEEMYQQTDTPTKKAEDIPPHFLNTHRNEKGINCCNSCGTIMPLADEAYGIIRDVNINFCYYCGTKINGGANNG